MRFLRLVRRTAGAGVCFGIVACADPAEPPPDPDAAAEVGEVEPLPHTLPPRGAATPRYVGLWAATAEGCSEPAWRFEERRIITRGEVSCEFQNVTLTDRGYDIRAECTAQAPPEPHNIQLTFAESARAMMITGGPWQSGTALVFCAALSPP